MRQVTLFSTLFALCAFAGNTGTSGPVSRGDLLKYRQVYTTSDVNLFVDPTGSDSNACTSTGTAACLTIQGALNKAPKNLRHRLTVTAAAGNYASFIVSGFQTDFGLQTTTAGLLIQGTLANSTGLATGTATGTATGGSAGSTSTFGTLVDAAQTWTTNDLRHRFVTIVSGTGAGQVKAIASNTGTTITIAGTWTAPDATSVYAVQDSATFITSCGTAPPSGGGTVSTANTAVRVASNGAGSTITLRSLAVSAACSFGVVHTDVSTLVLNRMQFTSTAGTSARVQIGAGGFLVDTISSNYSGTTGTHVSGGGLASVNASVAGNVGNTSGPSGSTGTIQNSVFSNGLVGVNLTTQRSATILGLEVVSAAGTGVGVASVTSNIQGLHIDCTSAATAVGLSLTTPFPTGAVSPDHVDFTDCNTAVRVNGPTGFVQSASALTATSVTTYFDVRNGGLLTFNSTPSGTVSGSEISLDNGAVTTTFAALASTECVTSMNYGSRVCRD